MRSLAVRLGRRPARRRPRRRLPHARRGARRTRQAARRVAQEPARAVRRLAAASPQRTARLDGHGRRLAPSRRSPLRGDRACARRARAPGGSLERLIERAHLKVRPAQLLFWAAAAGVGLAVLVSLVTSQLAAARRAAFVGGSTAPFAWISSKGRRAAAGIRRPAARRPDDDGGLAEGRPELRPQHAGDRRRRALHRRARSSAACSTRRASDGPWTRLSRRWRIASTRTSFRFVVMSVTIQREIGGSLADLFQTVSDTVRSRQQFRRKVRALTAMGRASAYVLVGAAAHHGSAHRDRQPRLPRTARPRVGRADHARRRVRDDDHRRPCPQEDRLDQGVMPDAAAARIRLSRRRARHRRSARHEAHARPSGVPAPRGSVRR